MDNQLDALQRVDKSPELKVLGAAEEVIHDAIAMHSPAPVVSAIQNLMQGSVLRGLAVAKLLADLQAIWGDMNVEDDFYNYIQAETGISPKTSQPYVKMWRGIFENEDVPQNVKERMYGWHMRALVYIYPSIKEGIFNGRWNEVLGCSNEVDVKELVRGERGEQTSSSSAVHLFLFRDGTLKARKGKRGEMVPIGYLKLNSKEDVAHIAIERITRAAGIVVMET